MGFFFSFLLSFLGSPAAAAAREGELLREAGAEGEATAEPRREEGALEKGERPPA